MNDTLEARDLNQNVYYQIIYSPIIYNTPKADLCKLHGKTTFICSSSTPQNCFYLNEEAATKGESKEEIKWSTWLDNDL